MTEVITNRLEQVSGIQREGARLYWFSYRPTAWDLLNSGEGNRYWEFFKTGQGRNKALAKLSQGNPKFPLRDLRIGDMSLRGLELASDTPTEADLLAGVKWPRAKSNHREAP